MTYKNNWLTVSVLAIGLLCASCGQKGSLCPIDPQTGKAMGSDCPWRDAPLPDETGQQADS